LEPLEPLEPKQTINEPASPREEAYDRNGFQSFHRSKTPSVSDLMARCKALDVLLWVEDGGLRFDAPSGALDDKLRAELRTNKAGLIAALAHEFGAEVEADHPEQVSAAVEPTAWPPRDPRLAGWPLDKRERWGRRANTLEDEGQDWRDAERQAFAEVLAERVEAGLSGIGPDTKAEEAARGSDATALPSAPARRKARPTQGQPEEPLFAA
jgi:TubC N-terminal docking domain